MVVLNDEFALEKRSSSQYLTIQVWHSYQQKKCLLDKNLKLKKIIGPYQSWEYMKEKYEGKSVS